MKHWYQKPHKLIADYIRTVLILEGFSESDTNDLPIFTNGMSALFCKTEKDQSGNENIIQIALFGKEVPEEHWIVKTNETIIAYFFKPFALAGMFNMNAAKLLASPIDLGNWHAHKTNALKPQLIYATSTSRKIEVLDNLLIQQLQQNKRECEIIKYTTEKIMLDHSTEIL